MAGDPADGDAADGDTAAGTDVATDSPGSKSTASTASSADARSVTVPTRVYKSVTVFSTLFAVLMVVVGFVLLDAATQRASISLAEADPVLALAGLGAIVLGAVTYAFSTRFKTAEMGNAKDADDEPSNNG